MPREKKDGRFLNLYLRTDLYNRLEFFCKETGVTKTFAVEKGLELYFKERTQKAIITDYTKSK